MATSEKKIEANRRNGEQHRQIAAERRVLAIRRMVQLIALSPRGPIVLAPMVELNATAVQEILRRMRDAGVARPYVFSGRRVLTWEPCGDAAALEAFIAKERLLTHSESTNRRARRRSEDGGDKDVSEPCVTHRKAQQQGVTRPDYIACLFGPARSAA